MIEKILEKFEELRMRYFLTIANGGDEKLDFAYGYVGKTIDQCKEIVQEVAREYGNGWIPCSERLPECECGAETKALLFQMAETNTIHCGYYGEGGMYRDKYFRTYTNATDGFDAKDVIAWQPLPAPYQKGE